MKQHILPAIRLTIVTLIFFSGVYTLVILGVAQLFPNRGKGEVIEQNGKRYYANIGQSFTDDKYFNSRPSAVGYNAAGSGGSNKGPSNEEYLGVVQARIDTFLVHNPGVKKANIPVELVTASGSGLDPDISEKAALVQVERIAKLRNVPTQQLQQLVKEHINGPLLGLFGPAKINVLKLNLALDQLK
ncbi:K+-transporting ATPase ATPase C chain [Dyadobacter sp. BE34]|uniref:Potassium-transporting ATPase KdpC subunit n=1 Tax=Dyadobacter fermentans TaxID=94254 RepID=A0ABU1QZ45_9BACT|nr:MULTISPECIES: K(+)-transporting ATPase subunit C [Dyadobacter]MDR6806385.1 K+-transporting ATPase ATPase C chain [Dyadobacter fermentans]MDR7044126.1 K+-transporting ATPase ATPase C chain [Dyadobacter sp. BE242]MDR7198437.1 K+-transporting ATPase ATPase C chain [Dyadobacter sp. BE34]MDR7216399.1 K+-transporting ATPase ATPase C chain [Dyadobacter sp. BE31]MDR7264074.1 K+-transporting ATPase ATPase C chain [Dyadobacter sp. BE32]